MPGKKEEKKSSAIKQFNVICSTTSTAIICDGFPSLFYWVFFSRDVHLKPKTLLFLGGLKVMDSGQLFIDDDVSLVAHFLPFVFGMILEGSADNEFQLFIFSEFLILTAICLTVNNNRMFFFIEFECHFSRWKSRICSKFFVHHFSSTSEEAIDFNLQFPPSQQSSSLTPSQFFRPQSPVNVFDAIIFHVSPKDTSAAKKKTSTWFVASFAVLSSFTIFSHPIGRKKSKRL